jgi:hypothetical protein
VALTQLSVVKIIDVSNSCSARQPEREIQRTDLDAVAAKKPQSYVLTNRLPIRRALTKHGVSRLALTALYDISDARTHDDPKSTTVVGNPSAARHWAKM